MSTYSHRNGETEPPTEAGWYWFNGYHVDEVGRRPKKRRTVLHVFGGVTAFEVPNSEGNTWQYAITPLDKLRGKWYGPVVPPWSDAQPDAIPRAYLSTIEACVDDSMANRGGMTEQEYAEWQAECAPVLAWLHQQIAQPATDAAPIGAIGVCLDRLVAVFDNDANNMPDTLYDSYIDARAWLQTQRPAGE